MAALHAIAAAVRFALEAGGLLVLGCWGASLPSPIAVRLAAAIAIPGSVAWTWSRRIAPLSPTALPMPARAIAGAAILALAGVALADRGHARAAMAWGVVVVLDAIVLVVSERPA